MSAQRHKYPPCLKWFGDKNLVDLIIRHQAIAPDLIMDISQLDVEDKIIEIRNKHVIIDSDVAQLYGVETKRINEAVNRNSEKFPTGYLLELTQEEWEPLKSQFATSIKGGKTKLPTVFTEKASVGWAEKPSVYL